MRGFKASGCTGAPGGGGNARQIQLHQQAVGMNAGNGKVHVPRESVQKASVEGHIRKRLREHCHKAVTPLAHDLKIPFPVFLQCQGHQGGAHRIFRAGTHPLFLPAAPFKGLNPCAGSQVQCPDVHRQCCEV